MAQIEKMIFSGEQFEEVTKRVFELLQPTIHDLVAHQLPYLLKAMIDDLLAKQRKDVADELVRILLEKALERQTSKSPA